jgi:HEAT repeat protein
MINSLQMDSFDRSVEDLAVKHRAKEALRLLMDAGSLAAPALRRGLRHPDPVVRVGCCRVLDHYLIEDAIPDLLENLDHEDAEVRAWAMHALACDRCKEGACRPGEDDSIPLAIRALADDPSPGVRKQAVALLFPAVHRRADVVRAIEQASDADPSPTVRKAATMRAPGGVMYLRTSPNRLDRKRVRTSGPRGHLSRK